MVLLDHQDQKVVKVIQEEKRETEDYPVIQVL